MFTDSHFFNLPESPDDIAFINEERTPSLEHCPYVGYGLEIEDSSLSMDLHTHVFPPSPAFGTLVESFDDSAEIECLGDHEYDSVFKFLNHILIEENLDEKPSMFHDPLALQATEKTFYDAIDRKYPPSPSVNVITESPKSLNERTSKTTGDSVQSSVTSSQLLVPLVNSSESNRGQIESCMNMHLIPSIFSHSESVGLFRKGMEEALKFLPTNNDLVVGLHKYSLPPKTEMEPPKVSVMVEKGHSSNSRGRKHLNQDSDLDARRRKQSAVYEDEVEELSDLFDNILLRNVKGLVISSKGDFKYLNGVDKFWEQNRWPLVPRNLNAPSKKQGEEINAVYLQSLLISCAEALSSNDVETAHKKLNQIRHCASPTGDACQRTANVFANGLEARLAGAGTRMYADLASKRISAADKLKACNVYLSACPFMEISKVFAYKMILKVAAKASTIHIVDFGISYGFQWPVLIQYLSIRKGGPPKLRITGIDFPQPGFRPAILVEETGQRLAKYCKRFNVPFEYQAIATESWDTIDINDLKLARDEALVVNCKLGFQNLPEETVAVESPKDGVLKLIRRMKPDLFVHSIVNGSFDTPLFVTRFREAFFYYSSLFDMLENTLPPNDLQRFHFEKEFYGGEVMNIIACEGKQRVIRPETYKQWQIRSRRAGFKVIPLDKEFIFIDRVKAGYHKDFLFIEDCNWILQGWKGRVLYGTSCWVPV